MGQPLTWTKKCEAKFKEMNTRLISVGNFRYRYVIKGVVWYLISRFGLCIDAGEMTNSLCIKTIEGTQKELSYAWFGIGCCGFCIEA